MSAPDDRQRVTSDEERARAILEQLKSVHAVDIARDLVIALVNYSSPKLGLSDETLPVRDLGDVRVSIELIRAIVDVVGREYGDAKTGDLHDTLAQLQLAYAHAVQLANAERAAGEQRVPPEASADAPRPGDDAAAKPTKPAEAAEETEGGDAGEGPDAGKPAPKKSAAPKKAPGTKKPAARKKAAGTKKPAARKKPAGES